MSAQTNVPSYWLNWRFFLCALFVFSAMLLSSFLIWKYEGSRKCNDQRESPGVVYEDEAWNTCTKGIHPNWLLGYRAFGFVVLLGLISGNAIADGPGIFIFYTQWTFTLVTIYFGFAASLSIYGCCVDSNKNCGNNENSNNSDEECGSYRHPMNGETFNMIKAANAHEERRSLRQIASIGGYILQILFQTCAGAVLLTDSVFWFIIFPFLTAKDYNLDFFILTMHSVNAVFLLGETFLNSMRFPLFRIAYFVLWTGIFVAFQWIVHACVSFWWPYPFLDLSSPYAPLWYGAVGFMHAPCFGVFALIVRFKYLCLSKYSKAY